jgi:FAD/FMN-containing dehydrogenase
LPQESQTIAALGTAVELLKGAQKVVAANLLPVAVELLSPSFAAAAGFSDNNHSLLLVRFSGLSRTVAHQALSASGLLEPHSIHVGPLEDDESQVWQALSAMPFQFSNRAMLRASVPPSSLQQFLDVVTQTCPAALWHAGAAEGKMRVIIDPEIEARNLLQILEGFRRQAESSGGSMIIEKLPEAIKGKIGSWGNLGSRGRLMARVKQQLDPQGLFSPNRFGS